jgi:hypothetical protein
MNHSSVSFQLCDRSMRPSWPHGPVTFLKLNERMDGVKLTREIEATDLVTGAREVERTIEVWIELAGGGSAHVRLEATRRIKGSTVECEARSYLFDTGRRAWWLLPPSTRAIPPTSPDQAILGTMEYLVERRDALQYLQDCIVPARPIEERVPATV